MATDIKVVVPDNIGATILIGKKTAGKYDVDTSKLDVANNLTLAVNGTKLKVTDGTGASKEVDLAPILPTIAADVFLKNVELQGDKLVFTVGEKNSTANDQKLTTDVSSLLNLKISATDFTGNGTATELKLKVKSGGLLKNDGTGLEVDRTALQAAVAQYQRKPDVRLVDATGQIVIGYIFSTEQ